MCPCVHVLAGRWELSICSFFFFIYLAEYLVTVPDPIVEFSAPILKHMNDDHSETTEAMINHYITGDVKVMCG